MASRSDFKSSRANYRENRSTIREIIDRQNGVIDKEFLFVSSAFRVFFLVGSLVLMLADRIALIASVPLFIITSMTWIYRVNLNNRINYYAVRWTEKIIYSESVRYDKYSSIDEENDQDFIDDLIRLRTMRPDGALQLYFEPIALLFAALILISTRLNFDDILNFWF